MATEKPKCPHCGQTLEKKPARKKKCPHCSEYIYVRGGELLTEEQIEERACVSRWTGILERLGVTRAMFTEQERMLSAEFGFEAPFRDTVWHVLNTLVRKQTSPLDLERLYLFMGDFVQEEGKDPTSYVQQAMQVKEASIRRQVLRHQTELGRHWRVEINTANDEYVCPGCRKAAAHRYQIDEFLRDMPIPGNCQNARGCRCGVSFTFVR